MDLTDSFCRLPSNVFCRLSQPCNGREMMRCDQRLSSTSTSCVSSALAADVFSTFSDHCSEVSENENVSEDNSRLSAWLSRLGLSSRLAEYTSLLQSVNPLSKSDSETAYPSATSVDAVSISGANNTVELESQGFLPCRFFAPRVLAPHVGLNTVMTMRKDASARSPCHSVPHHCLWNSSGTTSSRSKASVPVKPSTTQCHVPFTSRTPVEEKSPSLMSSVDSSPGLPAPAAAVDSVLVHTLSAAVETVSGDMLSTEPTSELLKSVTSLVVTSDVALTCHPVPTVETDGGSCDKMTSTFDAVSAVGEGWKTSTPAKRPQSLDVIPWSPLSRSACTLTGSLSTVVHSHANGTSSNSVSVAPGVIPASPVNVFAL